MLGNAGEMPQTQKQKLQRKTIKSSVRTITKEKQEAKCHVGAAAAPMKGFNCQPMKVSRIQRFPWDALKYNKKHAKNDHLEHQATKAKTLALAQIASKYGKY